ncbi:hypothetical protein BGZ94_008003 [Podila epigama]|nr:hypothetical protein BGZ94_008003 [Podila epigama]
MLSKHIRPYFYYIDIHGQVFLQDTVPKNFTSCFKNPRFLDFFIPRIRPNNTPWFSEYAYVSPCGSEMNFIQAADTPVVYHGLHDGQLLWAGTRKTPFLPHMVTVSALTGRIYHPLPPRMVTDSVPISGEQPRQAQEHEQQQEQEQYAYALIKSALVQAEFADGLDDESLEWQGQRYKLRSKT